MTLSASRRKKKVSLKNRPDRIIKRSTPEQQHRVLARAHPRVAPARQAARAPDPRPSAPLAHLPLPVEHHPPTPHAPTKRGVAPNGPRNMLAIADGTEKEAHVSVAPPSQHAVVHPSHPIQALAVSSKGLPFDRPSPPSTHVHPVASTLHPSNSTKPVWVDADCQKNLCPDGDCKNLSSNYKKWARILHPDKNGGSTTATVTFKHLQACKDSLQKVPPHAEPQLRLTHQATPAPPVAMPHSLGETSSQSFPWPISEGMHISRKHQASSEQQPQPRTTHSATPMTSAEVLWELWVNLKENYEAEKNSAGTLADEVLQEVNDFMSSNLKRRWL